MQLSHAESNMKIIKGDIIKLAQQGQFDVIVHGCNCFCTMGSGIAKAVKSCFPIAFQVDLKTQKGEKAKLGTYSSATVETDNGQLTIINAYTQFNWRGNGRKADYDAIRKVFSQLKSNYSGKRIGFPRIGAGLAGGEWPVISQIIERELCDEDYTLVEFSK